MGKEKCIRERKKIKKEENTNMNETKKKNEDEEIFKKTQKIKAEE